MEAESGFTFVLVVMVVYAGFSVYSNDNIRRNEHEICSNRYGYGFYREYINRIKICKGPLLDDVNFNPPRIVEVMYPFPEEGEE